MKLASVELAIRICADYKIIPMFDGIAPETDSFVSDSKDVFKPHEDKMGALSNHLCLEYLDRLRQNKHLLD